MSHHASDVRSWSLALIALWLVIVCVAAFFGLTGKPAVLSAPVDPAIAKAAQGNRLRWYWIINSGVVLCFYFGYWWIANGFDMSRPAPGGGIAIGAILWCQIAWNLGSRGFALVACTLIPLIIAATDQLLIVPQLRTPVILCDIALVALVPLIFELQIKRLRRMAENLTIDLPVSNNPAP